MRRLRRVARHTPLCFTILALLGLTLRVTLRDALPGLAAYYYATPPIILAAFSFFAAGGWLWQKRYRPAVAATILGAIFAVWWQRTAYFDHVPRPATGAMRVLCWNVGHGQWGWDGIIEKVRTINADVVGLIEADDRIAEKQPHWETLLPGYSVSDRIFGIQLLINGELTEATQGSLAGGGQYRLFSVHVRGAAFQVLLIDIKSNPLRPRRAAFAELQRLVSLQTGPLLFMGDFNTPADSVFFDAFRLKMSNAFERGGQGYAATWPIPMPVLVLDQLWMTPHWDAQACWLEWSWHSDHRPLVFEGRLRDNAN